MGAFSETSLAKYVRGVKELPPAIFNWHLFVTVIGFALGGTPKGQSKRVEHSYAVETSLTRALCFCRLG